MPNLNRFVHYACGFVDFEGKGSDDIPSLMESFVKFCDSYSKITNYYLIAHDETNVLHIHFIFYSLSQVQLMTYFNKLRYWFVDKEKVTRDENGISVAKCESINAHLKYLVHQDSNSITANKKRYEIDDFISNSDIDIIDNLIKSKKGQIDAFMLRDAVLDSANEFEIMVRLGLPVYHRYANEIRYMREERVYLRQLREQEREEKLDAQLPF